MTEKRFQTEIVDPKEFASAVADEIVYCLKEALEEKQKASLVLAGGATPSAIYRLLAMPPRINEISWKRVNLFWGDERWVSKDNIHNNYRLANEILVSGLDMPESNVFAIDTSLESPSISAKAYAETILSNTDASNPFPIDLLLLGIGDDAHSASLFPVTASEWQDSSDLVIATTNPGSSDVTQRVSLNIPAFKKAKKIVFLVKGEGKAEAIKRIFEAEIDKSIPAHHLLDMNERIIWFVDTSAATLLND